MVTIIVHTTSGEKAAEYDAVLGEWKYFDEVLQRRMETGMIEGVEVLGGSGPKYAGSGDDKVIGDTIELLMPGSEYFEDAYWDYVLGDEYRVETVHLQPA